MKNLIKNLLLFLVIQNFSLAAQKAEFGALNIVNLIPSDSPCEVLLGGKRAMKNGLKPGQNTGWGAVPVGNISLEISQGDLEKQSGSLRIEKDIRQLIAIYLEPAKKKKSDGSLESPRIRIKSFPTFGSERFGLRVATTCQADNRFQIGPMRFDLDRFKPKDIPNWNGSGFDVRHKGKSIGYIEGESDAGSYYLLIGSDNEDRMVTAVVSADDPETE